MDREKDIERGIDMDREGERRRMWERVGTRGIEWRNRGNKSEIERDG